MSTRLGKWMILGTIALALVGFYGIKERMAEGPGIVCKERVTEKNNKMIKSGLPILEAVTRRMIKM